MTIEKYLKSYAGLIIVAAVAISFLLKMGIGYYLSDTFLGRGNSHTPLNALAFNLLDHRAFSIIHGYPSVDYEPLYPLLLAAGYGIAGKTWLGVTLIQALLHAATTWVIFLLTQRIAGRTAAVIASLYHAFYPYLLFHSLSVIDTTLYVFLIFFMTFLAVKTIERRVLWIYCLIGISLSLALLTRGSTIAFVPVPLAIMAYFATKDGLRLAALRLGIVALACSLVLAPWVVRNYHLTGVPIVSTHGAFGLWQGNNSRTYDLLSRDISLDEVYRKDPPEIYLRNSTKERGPRDAISVAQDYQSEAIAFIVENPHEFIRLALLKFKKFWSWNINPRMDGYLYSEHSLRQSVYFVSYFPLLLLFPLGAWILLRRKFWPALALVGTIASYTAAHMIVMGFTRARLPLDPVLMIFASVFLASLLSNRATLSSGSRKERVD